MRVGQRLDSFVGEWAGENDLRMMPEDAFTSSPSTATATSAAGGSAVMLAYTWADFDGAPQDGLLVLGDGPLPGRVAAIWVDAWHQQPRWMDMAGSVSEHRVSVSGAYGEGDESGGWHIHLHLDDPQTLVMTMDNEMSDTGAYEVVRATWRRA